MLEEKQSLSEVSPFFQDHSAPAGSYVKVLKYASGNVEAISMPSQSLRTGKSRPGRRQRERSIHEIQADRDRAARRAKMKVKRLCEQGQFDRLLTLTFRENVTDRKESFKCWDYFIKLMRQRYKGLNYVVSWERQKRGAYHFHIALRGFYSVRSVRTLWLRACAGHGGNIDITTPRRSRKGGVSRRISLYLAKYISKSYGDGEQAANSKGQRAYASGGLFPVLPVWTGFLAYGYPVIKAVDKIFLEITKKPVQYVQEHQINETLTITYMAT